MPSDLIYDVGVNVGTDSAYYLHKGFRVVGIEASPPLADQLRLMFSNEIATGQYTLLNVGVAAEAGEFDFWVCDTKSEWSSFDRKIASRNGAEHHSVKVKTLRFDQIVAEHGIPLYCKVDIEGNDWLCLAGMDPQTRPRYVSIEMSYEKGDRDFKLLRDLGFKEYKIISQVSWSQPTQALISLNRKLPYRLRRISLAAEGLLRGVRSDGDWKFEFGSSGSFAESTPGRWHSFDEAYATWLKLHHLAKSGSSLGDWYDIHAR
ncbi:FkbM family methyltransferase [Sphingomonas yantingensis]|uniref:FkbM family methyltransferase n=1 Tax=Sphingomonas yantingensis TaxID=1241761 RepID=A0A7W9AMH5_9SPHN|nr:FkbM family methyltransferase [Sphingomonas yantingensis]